LLYDAEQNNSYYPIAQRYKKQNRTEQNKTAETDKSPEEK
jgi:hypothetical protein